MEFVESFKFELKKSIAIKGGDATSITVYAPNNTHRDLISTLEGMISKTQAHMAANPTFNSQSQTEQATETDESIDGSAIISMVKTCFGQDDEFYSRFCSTFKKLLTSNDVCKLEPQGQLLNSGYFNSLWYKDVDRLMEDYLSFFIIQSNS